MPTPGSKHTGWWQNPQQAYRSLYFAGTEVMRYTASAFTFLKNSTFSGTVTVDGASTLTGAIAANGKLSARNFAFGAGEAVTIASGVATITKSYVILDAEGAGTTDQLDTITKADAAQGDVVLLTVNATDTITVDDANINLGAATRAIAPGGALVVYYDGTEWTELAFIAATDNV